MGSSGINLAAALSIFGRLQASTSAPINIGNGAASDAADSLTTGPWTPPQYSQPALTILTVPPSKFNTGTSDISQSADGTFQLSTGVAGAAYATRYIFDAVLRLNHNRRLHKTQHPVLTGANIADHAYIEPVRVTLEIGMSDAMAPAEQGVWVGASTKSVSAWQVIKQLQLNKTLVSLATRLDTYSNMLITEATAPDDVKTLHGLRCTIVLEEIIAGSVSSSDAVSVRPQTTDSTPLGVVQCLPVDPAILAQHMVTNPTGRGANVPGAGNISSNNINQLAV